MPTPHRTWPFLTPLPLLSAPPQFLWAMYQLKVKKAMHAAGPRSVSARLANSATQGQLLQHAAQLRAGQAAADDHLTPVESFTGAVPKVLKGSKRYWCRSALRHACNSILLIVPASIRRVAFIQLMAMCLEYGAPEFFLTLTANEMGWTDLRRVSFPLAFPLPPSPSLLLSPSCP